MERSDGVESHEKVSKGGPKHLGKMIHRKRRENNTIVDITGRDITDVTSPVDDVISNSIKSQQQWHSTQNTPNVTT